MNALYFGDNLDILKRLSAEHPEGFIDLIYIDPPFNSKRNYNILFEDADLEDTKAQKEAFADTWSQVSYIDTLHEIQEIDLNLYNVLNILDKTSLPKAAVSYLCTMALRVWYMRKVLKDTVLFRVRFIIILIQRVFIGDRDGPVMISTFIEFFQKLMEIDQYMRQ